MIRGILAAASIALSIVVASPVAAQQTLEQVRQRGSIVCGVNQGLEGFAIADAQGAWRGFDVDFCRALAAAIFDDPTKVTFVPVSVTARFDVLAAGRIDVLSRNTTHTFQRDVEFGFEFPAVTFFDGQAFLARRALRVSSVLELGGATVCVSENTTSEEIVDDFFRAQGLRFEKVAVINMERAMEAYVGGQCDVFTADASALFAQRARLQRPEDHVVLPELISKEPLGPAVRQGDRRWVDVVRWVHHGMVTAEELGISSQNVANAVAGDRRPDVKRLLGIDGGFGRVLGLTDDWMVRVLRHVGNYGEVFERNVGESTPLGFRRGLNALWLRGGLQYAPPFR